MSRWTIIATVSVLGVIGVLGLYASLTFQPTLDSIHLSIEGKHKGVAHISVEQYAAYVDSVGNGSSGGTFDEFVLFDVREASEFNVSHLAGAVHLSPDSDIEDFENDYAELVRGRRVLFYCSVGRRSSDKLAQLTSTLSKLGAHSSFNLKGGIFAWVNQGESLDGEFVHPYNEYWGRLINDQNRMSYSAKND